MAIQLLSKESFVSRANFSEKLLLGEGAVKTLISHLKTAGLASTTKSGTFLTNEGKKLANWFDNIMPYECTLTNGKVFLKKYNHAIILRRYSWAIKTGLEQRDFAILYGSEACVTLIFKNQKFVFPSDEKNAFHDDRKTEGILLKKLKPKENDVIIISSSDDPFIATISAKNSAIGTISFS